MTLRSFVIESNKIEGIWRPEGVLDVEEEALVAFVQLPAVTVVDIESLVSIFTAGQARLRQEEGMDVRVGSFIPPKGGPGIVKSLEQLVANANEQDRHPYYIHHDYETLHPFSDGNGRSGRALWLWGMLRVEGVTANTVLSLGFLHLWYYQSLQFGRG